MKSALALLTAFTLSTFALPARAHHESSGNHGCYLVFWKGNPAIASIREVNGISQEPWKMGFVSKFRLVGEGFSIPLP